VEIRIESLDLACVVTLAGSMDGLTADQLLAALREHVATGKSRLVADMSGVEYTSSAGLRTLLVTVKEVRAVGGDLRIAAVRPNVTKVLELSGFTRILQIFPEVGDAVASFG